MWHVPQFRSKRPLSVLCVKGKAYRWKFPFGLSASNLGHTALLRLPEDLRHFCDMLEIPLTEIREWYAEFRPPTARRTPPRSEPMVTQETHYRRQRSPSETRAQLPAAHPNDSLAKPPHTRRAHHDHYVLAMQQPMTSYVSCLPPSSFPLTSHFAHVISSSMLLTSSSEKAHLAWKHCEHDTPF